MRAALMARRPCMFKQQALMVATIATVSLFITGVASAAPTITDITPNTGHVDGGTSVLISGSGFDESGTTVVQFDGVAATNVVVQSGGSYLPGDETMITCITPSGTLGLADVTVINPDFSSDTLVDGFEYTSLQPLNPFFNPDFEAGSLSGWSYTEPVSPDIPLSGGCFGYLNGCSAIHSWTAGSPGAFELWQDVTIPDNATHLLFDTRYAFTHDGTLDFELNVVIEPVGGGSPIQTTNLLTLTPGVETFDSGPITHQVPLLAFVTNTVRVKFQWTVPESISSSGIVVFDNVRLDYVSVFAAENGVFGDVNREVGLFTQTGSPSIDPIGMAYDRNSDCIYALDENTGDLYAVDPETGEAKLIGPPGVGLLDGLAFDPNTNTLYGASFNQLHRIDTLTAAATAIGANTLSNNNGLAFDPFSNTLYGVDTVAGDLVAIDTGTGTPTTIGAIGFSSIGGLAFCERDKHLYGIDSSTGNLVRIDPATGAGTDLGNTGQAWGTYLGMTSRTPRNTISFTGTENTLGTWGILDKTPFYTAIDSAGFQILGMAFDPDTENVYIGDTTNIYKINFLTFDIDLIGPSGGFASRGGLAYDPNADILYGTDGSSVITIDTSTGAGFLLFSSTLSNCDALAYDRFSDTLYGISDPETLIAINTSNGAPITIGSAGMGANLDGLSYCDEDGYLYALDGSTGLEYRIDPGTGAGTLLGSVGTFGGDVGLATGSVLPNYMTELFPGADPDLDGLRLTYVPNGTPILPEASPPAIDMPTSTTPYYEVFRESHVGLSIDPTAGDQLILTDDDSISVPLTKGEISLYGKTYSSIYVGSNGYVSLGSVSTGYFYTSHFDVPRIAPFMTDLNPESGGSIIVKELWDRVVVTWLNVPYFGLGGSNTFQVEIFYIGNVASGSSAGTGSAIRFTYASIGLGDEVAVGLSEGEGMPANFVDYDLSESKLFVPDHDGDGMPTFWELLQGVSDWNTFDSGDSDGDGIADDAEYIFGTSPYHVDSDFDGVSDYDEIFVYGTVATAIDSDGDGASDGEEIAVMSDPLSAGSLPAPATWVDFDYFGLIQIGTFLEPYDLLSEGLAVVPPAGLIRVKPGTSLEAPITINQEVTIEAIGGTATIE